MSMGESEGRTTASGQVQVHLNLVPHRYSIRTWRSGQSLMFRKVIKKLMQSSARTWSILGSTSSNSNE